MRTSKTVSRILTVIMSMAMIFSEVGTPFNIYAADDEEVLVSENEVSDNEVSENEVSENEVSENEVSENEAEEELVTEEPDNDIEEGEQTIAEAAGDIAVTGIEISSGYINLKIGDKDKLTATVLPENATNKKVDWTSKNEEVATVSSDGTVTAVAEGSAIICAATDDGGFQAFCKVVVVKEFVRPIPDDPDQPVPEDDPEVDFGEESYDNILSATEARDIYLVKGQKLILKSTQISTGDKKILGSSKSKNGYITVSAKKKGVTSLTAPGEGGEMYTHTVYINTPAFSEKSVKMEIGQSRDFAINTGADTDKYTVFYSSSDRDVAYVANGKLYAFMKGSATIYAHINGKKYSCKVIVKNVPTPKSMDGIEELKLQPLQSFTIKYDNGFKANDATWEVSGNAVTVNKNKLTASAPGEATVTGTDKNGQSRSFKVTVPAGLKRIIHITKGGSKSVKFDKLPGKSRWVSLNDKIATVNKGKIKAVGTGTTTVYTVYNRFSFAATVIVDDAILDTDESLRAGKTYSLNLTSGDIYTIQSSAITQRIAWISNKPEVARVNNVGKVIATAPGTATLKAKINGKSVTIKVTVTGK